MAEIETESDELQHLAHLTDQQRQALRLHLQGMSDARIAETLGLQRSTVWRWRTQDVRYTVALDTERNELWSDIRERLRGLATEAVDVIEIALEDNDVKAAWRVLETLGLDKIHHQKNHLQLMISCVSRRR